MPAAADPALYSERIGKYVRDLTCTRQTSILSVLREVWLSGLRLRSPKPACRQDTVGSNPIASAKKDSAPTRVGAESARWGRSLNCLGVLPPGRACAFGVSPRPI